jgi:hypothetical protein
MASLDVVDELIQKLKATGLADRPGKLLYSGIGTLCVGKVYLLGFNPGGDPDIENASSAADLANRAAQPSDWNEYIDGRWAPRGHVRRQGTAPMQRRVVHLLEQLGLPTRSVCASNLIFARSRDSSELSDKAQLAEQCWPVHQFIIDHVCPQGIISIGGTPVFDFICKHAEFSSTLEQFQAGHGDWKCAAAQVRLGSRNLALVSVPNLARYAIDRHPGVVRWVGTKLGL